MTLNPNLDSGWIGRKGESICARESTEFHTETKVVREMTLPAIRKRFDWGAWDSADCKWLYAKAEQHAEMLEALERARQEHSDMATLLEAWARESMDGSWSTHQVGANRSRADQCRRFAADAEKTIRKAKGESL